MKFWKYHGLGNDFLIIDNMNGDLTLSKEQIARMCDRRFGIGADGVVFVEKSAAADIRMVIFNSDGSRPEMCGNAVRCFSKFVYDKAIIRKEQIAVETDAGIMYIVLHIKSELVDTAVVNMGRPDFEPKNIPSIIAKHEIISHPIVIHDQTFVITSLLMGVPHTVVFVEDLSDEMVIEIGKLIENSSYFPNKTNVNFVKVLDKENMILRTWERGAGYTYACGTGACASVVAAVANGYTNERVKVQLRGGDLVITWREKAEVYMEGPAAEVFEGIYSNC